MDMGTITCEIRAATCIIDDKSSFLRRLQEVARQFHVHIICFNADLLVGRRHAEAAVHYAVRSFESGDSISNTLEMEALLYAAGSRQCNVAASFGIHEGENRLWVCCYPPSGGVWEALAPILSFRAGLDWDEIDKKKQDSLMQLFGITDEELNSLESTDRIVDLVLERVALLQVLR
jgi:KEOPS complex subunit Cgi121